MAVKTLEWIGDETGHLRLLDQTKLPTRIEFIDCRTVPQVVEAIKMLRVRGAPARELEIGHAEEARRLGRGRSRRTV